VTGHQLRRLIDKLGMSQSAAARQIGISDRQMRRLITLPKVPRLYECAMLYLREHPPAPPDA
jgi:hypothetical protein